MSAGTAARPRWLSSKIPRLRMRQSSSPRSRNHRWFGEMREVDCVVAGARVGRERTDAGESEWAVEEGSERTVEGGFDGDVMRWAGCVLWVDPVEG